MSELHTLVVRAIAELRDVRCTDPAAAEALGVVRLTVHTLETWWLPVLRGAPEGAELGDRR